MLLKDFAVAWSLFHTLVMFMLLFVSRYDKRKTIILTLSTMGPLIIINLILFILLKFDGYGTLMLLTLSLPSCIFFWLLSKNRDGRFFFTFCMVDTMVLEIIYISNIIDHYLTPDNHVFIFVLLLIIYPLLELWIVKKLRPVFLDVQKHVKRGWGSFAIIGVVFYLAITLLMTYPTPIVERPSQLPALIMLFVLMPVIYIHIIITLRRQQKYHEIIEQENILKLQVSGLTARMDELAATDEKIRIERHNFRHKLKTLAGLIKKEQYDECLVLLEEYDSPLETVKARSYCRHAVLDATLSVYLIKAQESNIKLDVGFAFPDVIPVNEAELATAIANALENAINACEKLPPENRFIEIKVVNYPRFMMRIVNTYTGNVEFDEDNIPVNNDSDHGFGTRYIAAFCHKNNGYYDFSADGEKFTLTLNF